MNTERYVWPVIIAVSLHSLLLLSGTDSVVIFPPGKTKVGPSEPPPDIHRIEMASPENDETEPGAGKAEPITSQVDMPRLADPQDIFTIRVTPSAPSIRPVLILPENPSGPPGREGMDGPVGLPALPSDRHLDRAPRATVQPAPNYPATMWSSATSGSVTVEFVVDTTGRVMSADAVRWTHRDFVDSAVRAVLRWQFEPGTINGRRVRFRMAVPIEFNAAN